MIQTTAASDVNEATKRVVTALPWGFDGPGTGIVLQCHDSLVVECKEEHAEQVAREMKKQMDSYLGDMPLPTDCQVGKSLGGMKDTEW